MYQKSQAAASLPDLDSLSAFEEHRLANDFAHENGLEQSHFDRLKQTAQVSISERDPKREPVVVTSEQRRHVSISDEPPRRRQYPKRRRRRGFKAFVDRRKEEFLTAVHTTFACIYLTTCFLITRDQP